MEMGEVYARARMFGLSGDGYLVPYVSVEIK